MSFFGLGKRGCGRVRAGVPAVGLGLVLVGSVDLLTGADFRRCEVPACQSSLILPCDCRVFDSLLLPDLNEKRTPFLNKFGVVITSSDTHFKAFRQCPLVSIGEFNLKRSHIASGGAAGFSGRPIFRPTSVDGVTAKFATPFGSHALHTSFPADLAALPAHGGHHSGNCRGIWNPCFKHARKRSIKFNEFGVGLPYRPVESLTNEGGNLEIPITFEVRWIVMNPLFSPRWRETIIVLPDLEHQIAADIEDFRPIILSIERRNYPWRWVKFIDELDTHGFNSTTALSKQRYASSQTKRVL